MAMNVSQFQPSDNFNMAEFNDKITQINSGVNSEVSALKTLINEGVKFEIASYVGTGLNGASNPSSLTFSFAPTFVIYMGSVDSDLHVSGHGSGQNWLAIPKYMSTSYRQYDGFAAQNYSDYSTYGKISPDGKTISWYNTSDVSFAQLNFANDTYYYIAIGFDDGAQNNLI